MSPSYRIDIPKDYKNVRNWHQESNYFKDVSDGDDAIVCWIPLNKAYKKNGSVIILPDSHQLGARNSKKVDGKFLKSEQYKLSIRDLKKFKKKAYISANKGDIAFIHFNTFHSSGKNISNNVRLTGQIRFAKNYVHSYNPPILSLIYD